MHQSNSARPQDNRTQIRIGYLPPHLRYIAAGQRGKMWRKVQELLRHANSRITLEVYTQATTSNKRATQSKVVRMMVPNLGETKDEIHPQKAGRMLIAPISNPEPPSFGVTHHPKCFRMMAGTTGLEPATSAVTGQRSNQLSYVPRRSFYNLDLLSYRIKRFAVFAIVALF
jgi:hypothetical protein